MNIASQIRHQLTFLAGLGGLFLSWNLIAPEQADAVNQAGKDLIDPLMIILGSLAAGLMRLLIAWLGNLFRRGAMEVGDRASGVNSGGGSLPLLLITGATAALMGGLPSCSGPLPLTGSISYRDPKSGAKGGLVFDPAGPPTARLAVPIIDPETGEQIGYADLSAEIPVDRASGK